jgi:hypothetical protein
VMKTPDIKKYLMHLGATRIKETKNWVMSPCVLAPWTHDKGTDTNPSAGVSRTEGRSHYHCFTCHANHDLYDLILIIQNHLKSKPVHGNYDFKACLELCDKEQDPLDFDFSDDYEAHKATKADRTQVRLHKFPLSMVHALPMAYGNEYAYSRGLTDKLIELFDVRIDVINQRIVFPIIGKDNYYYGMHGRIIPPAEHPLRYRAYRFLDPKTNQELINPAMPIGHHLVNMAKPVVLCEGMFDLVPIIKAYGNTVCCKSSSPSKDFFHLYQDATVIVTAFDNGTGGDTGRAAIKKGFPGATVIHCTPPDIYSDFGDTPQDLVNKTFNFLN